MTAKRLVFFGNERLATSVSTTAPVLRGLIESGYDIPLVISHYELAQSRHVRDLEIESVARAAGIEVLLPERPAEVTDHIKATGAHAAVLAAYGRIIPKSILDLFPQGIINLHPSLLPIYRGPTPIEQAILDGVRETGVSIMKVTAAMDAGPVFSQKRLELKGSESKQKLADKLLQLGADELLAILPGILGGSLQPETQDDSRATTTAKITKTDGQIDWGKPALQLEREVRAYLGWPGSHAGLAGKDIIVTAARVLAAGDHADASSVPRAAGQAFKLGHDLAISCGDGSMLIIDRLKPAGKREMTGTEFLAGHPIT